ncbi:hypothetical protein H0W80_02180 [Candidatus Saccharibacteria bacterium]|nr:hypothetical protein [Candidatus Saccharibacteria bacterium]
MRKKLLLATTTASTSALLFVTRVYAACDITSGARGGADCAQGAGTATDLVVNVKGITNTLLLAIGAIAVIMIIIGGIRYALSGGNEQNVKAAKDTIQYAIVGLVIALLSYAIVNFVLRLF